MRFRFTGVAHISGSIILLFLLKFPGYGQCLKGLIKDSIAGKPLAGVNVMVLKPGRSTLSDQNGAFAFVNLKQGIYQVKFSMIGYIPRVITLKTSQEKACTFKPIAMLPVQLALAEVTISSRADRPQIQRIRRGPFPVTVIDGKQIEGRSSTLNEILDRQAGVRVRQNGGLGNAALVNIRGLEGKRVQIYLDGNPLNTPDGSFNLNDLPTQFIDRIEIYKGIVPPELGGDGLGGAINIITIHPETDYLDAGYSVGSFNTHTGTLVYKRVFPEIGLEVGAGGGVNYSANDYQMRSPYPPYLSIIRNNDRYMNAYGALALTFTKTWFDEAKIEFLRYYNDKGFQGIKSNYRYAHAKSDLYIINPELEKSNFLITGLDLKMNTFLLHSSSSTIDTARDLYDFDNRPYPNSGRGEIGYIPNFSQDKLNELRNRLNLKYKLSGAWSFNLNNDLRYSRREPYDPVADEFIKQHINPAAEAISRQNARLLTSVTSAAIESRHLNGRLVNLTSVRHYYSQSSGTYVNLFYGSIFLPEPISNAGSHWGANTALSYELNSSLLLKLAVEKNYRLPQTQEVYGDGILTTANPLLKPETSWNFSSGLVYNHYTPGGGRVQLELNAFNMNLTDMIQLGGNGTTFGYQNLGKVRIIGVEAEGKVDLGSHWFLSGNITYQDLKDRQRYINDNSVQPNPTFDLRVPNVPYFFFNHALEYRPSGFFGCKNINVRSYLESAYTSRYYYGYKLSALQDLDIPANYVHTLGLEMRMLRTGLNISGEIQNLTNIPVINNFNNPLPGRSFRIKLRYTRAEKDKTHKSKYNEKTID